MIKIERGEHSGKESLLSSETKLTQVVASIAVDHVKEECGKTEKL